MATRDGTCFETGLLTGKVMERMSKRGKNRKTGIGVGRRELGRETHGIPTGFPVFPSTSRFSSHQCRSGVLKWMDARAHGLKASSASSQ
jgi:hypothetical protein